MCRLTSILVNRPPQKCLFCLSESRRDNDVDDKLSLQNYSSPQRKNNDFILFDSTQINKSKKDQQQPRTVKKKKSDVRKEKCRIAAQSRRSREGQLMEDLQSCLPVSIKNLPRLEKSTVLRLATQSLALFKLLGSDLDTVDLEPSIHLQSDNTFGIVFDLSTGQVIYLPPSLAKLSGLNWTYLISSSVSDLFEEERFPQSNEILRLKACTFPTKSKPVSTSPNGHVLVNCWSSQASISSMNLSVALFHCLKPTFLNCLSEVVRTKLHNKEISYYSVTHSSHNTGSLLFEFIEKESFYKLTGYLERDVLGQSLLEFIHLDDVIQLAQLIITLKSEICVESKYLRFLTKYGTYRWTKIILSKSLTGPIIYCKYIICHEYIADNVSQIVAQQTQHCINDKDDTTTIQPTTCESFNDLLCCLDLDSFIDNQKTSVSSSQSKMNEPDFDVVLRAPKIDLVDTYSLGIDEFLDQESRIDSVCDDVQMVGFSSDNLSDTFDRETPRKRNYEPNQALQSIELDCAQTKRRKFESEQQQSCIIRDEIEPPITNLKISHSMMNFCDNLSRQFVEELIAVENQSEFNEKLNRTLCLEPDNESREF